MISKRVAIAWRATATVCISNGPQNTEKARRCNKESARTASLRAGRKAHSVGPCSPNTKPTSLEHSPARRPARPRTVVPCSLFAGAARRRRWNRDRSLHSRFRQILEAARRRFHQAGQDDDRPDYLLYGRARGGIHGRYAKAWAGRLQNPALF